MAELLFLPNPCLPSVPLGKDSRDNVVTATWGEKPAFAFAAKAHWDLGPALGIMDFERAAKLSGSGFVVLKGPGARLARALVSWFLDTHTEKHGYTELAVPYLVTPQTMQGTGQLPKFADQLYACKDDDLLLIPTAEVPARLDKTGGGRQGGNKAIAGVEQVETPGIHRPQTVLDEVGHRRH